MKIIQAIMVLSVFAATAQAQTAVSPTLNDRIAMQIGQLNIQNTALLMQIEQIQAQLKTAQDHARALEDKYEPKQDQPK